jgi:plasmid stabilization system protein ParE
MGYPVVPTPQSQVDLAIIVTYIARDDPERAEAFGNLLIDKALSIGAMIERGRTVPELNDLQCGK